jgi:TonB family protein
MSRDARFWRNVTIISLAHVAVFVGLVWLNSEPKRAKASDVVWMNAAAGDAGNASSAAAAPATKVNPVEEPSATPPRREPTPPPTPDDEEEAPVLTAAKSEIQLPVHTPKPTPSATPKPTPTPTAKPTPSPTPKSTPTPTPKATPTPSAKSTPSPTPKPSPKATPKPTPKPTPKKTLVAKASPKPSVKPTATPAEKETPDDEEKPAPDAEKKAAAKVAVAKNEGSADDGGSEKPTKKATAAQGGKGSGASGGGGKAAGAGGASEFGWYGSMLHDRFYSAWVQPTTIVASGAKWSALVKLRIEKDGRVSHFDIVKPSGNVVVDESIAAVAKQVTQVDPLPAGLGGGYYEVNINFELNSEQ